jgi:hypothetical protein
MTSTAVLCVPLFALSNDLPIGVFPDNIAAPELEQIAALDPDLLAGFTGPCQEPLGNASVATHPMAVIAVMNIRDTAEASRQSSTDLILSDVAGTPGIGPPRQIKGRILREELHYPIEIVSIECSEQLS